MSIPPKMTKHEADEFWKEQASDFVIGPEQDKIIRDELNEWCGCSTTEEAIKAGTKLAAQLLENQCSKYLLAIGVTISLCSMYATARNNSNSPTPPKDVEEAVDTAKNNAIRDLHNYMYMNPDLRRHVFEAIEAAMAQKLGENPSDGEKVH